MHKNNSDLYYDVIVVGGGIIGSSFALCLAQSGFRVILIEKNIQKFLVSESNIPDLRVLAINYNSIDFLTAINVWRYIDKFYCTLYSKLETWEYQASKIMFDSEFVGLSKMGYIIEHQRLRTAIWQIFNKYETLTLCYPASILSIKYSGTYWYLILSDNRLIVGRLLVGADGINSDIRKLSGFVVSGWQYRQSCMVLCALAEKKQKNTVWQIITPSGPKGCLPLYDNWVSLMWYDKTENIRQLQQLSLLELEKKIQSVFVQKLGNIRLYKVSSYPLFCQHAHNYVRPGVALIGDAAHCIHPLAGQGINIGFRDAELLAKVLIDARFKEKCWSNIEVLKRYQYSRRYDNLFMQFGIHAFYLIFSNENFFLKIMRNTGCILINRSNFFKKKILRYALGILK